MSRKGQRGMIIDGLIMPTKIRKRGCSSSSSPSSYSSSSRICSYRLNKRAIMVGKNRGGMGMGMGRSRSNTPVPTWRTNPLMSAVDSPQSGRPISARRLAATLWEMNETPSSPPKPKIKMSEEELMKRQQQKRNGNGSSRMDKILLPPQLLDPPHSPTVSEKMVRSGTGSRRRRTPCPSISQRLMGADQNAGVVDSISSASFMEIECRSRPQTLSGSVIGNKSRLKDVSSALTTSKELLTIISRMWGHTKQPSSTISLVSALHTELERARLQVNQLIQEQRSDVNYLLKCFAEEKASWRVKEKQAVEAAIGELEMERKLRRRLESFNTKLRKEVGEMKSSLVKVVKELESEKRARELTEQVCDELARNLDEDRAEVEKEREMLELADKLREERVQMKLSEAKHQFEEKNSDVNKLRKQLEVFLRAKRESKEGSGEESDLHSIELDLNNVDKWGHTSAVKARNSRRSSLGIQRSISDGVEWGNHSPSREKERPWPPRDPLPETSGVSKSEAHSARRSRC